MNESRPDRLMAALRWRALLLQGVIALHFAGITLVFCLFASLLILGSPQFAIGSALALAFVSSLPTALVIVLAALIWVWRAHANLRDLGLPDLKYSPGAVVGSWFVPLMNLVTPPRAMRELWNRSAGEDQYQAEQDVAVISGWWSCLLGGAVFQAIFVGTISLDAIPGVRVFTSPLLVTLIGGLGMILLLASSGFLFAIVRRITRNQGSLVLTKGVFD